MRDRRDKDYDPGVLLVVLTILIAMLYGYILIYSYYYEFFRIKNTLSKVEGVVLWTVLE